MREYIKKKRGIKNTQSENVDVSIHMNKSGVIDGIQRYSVVVSMKKEVMEKITDTGFVLVSHDREKKRMYFEAGNGENGYKIGFPKDCRRFYFRFNASDPLYFSKFNGAYNLEFDEEEHLYYIDAK